MRGARLVGAGVFVLVGFLVFAVGLFLIGERRNLFQKRFTVRAEFAALGQLESGAVVRVAGADAGEVVDIEYPDRPDGKFRVRMLVREDLHPLVRTDSLAWTQTEGLVGAIFVNIASGTAGAPPLPDGGTIPSREPFAIADLLGQASQAIGLVTDTVEALRGDIEHAVQQVAATADDAHGLLADLRPELTIIAKNGARISGDTSDILASVREGRGTLGKLVQDDALYTRIRTITEQAAATMANVQAMTADARQVIARVQSGDGPAQGLIGDMRTTVTQAREATADLADNMEALKRNFLFRGFFNRRGYFDLDALSPDEYRRGALERGGRKAMRIWLSSAVLFASPAPGASAGAPRDEVLTDEGRARLDAAMATFLRFLPAAPLVVEGFAGEGTEDEQFRRSSTRAAAVREYLMGRFNLPAQNTGLMPLGREAEGSPDGHRWDGVALAVFLEPSTVAAPRVAPAAMAPVLEPVVTNGGNR